MPQVNGRLATIYKSVNKSKGKKSAKEKKRGKIEGGKTTEGEERERENTP